MHILTLCISSCTGKSQIKHGKQNFLMFYDAFTKKREDGVIDCMMKPLNRTRYQDAAEHSCLSQREQNLRW